MITLRLKDGHILIMLVLVQTIVLLMVTLLQLEIFRRLKVQEVEQMGWAFPNAELSLEDVLNLIKGFVDILILASGYQSSGLPATWDPQNIKKAIQWGLFFEDVFRRLRVSDDYQESVKELDAALIEMKTSPNFPQGLRDLSSSTLSKARDFVLKHMVHTLPLTDVQLSAVLTAAVEMDLNDLRGTEYDCLDAYVEKLMLQNTSTVPQPSLIPNIITKKHVSSIHSEFIIQELSKRQGAVSCISSVEKGLDILSKSVTNVCEEIPQDDISRLNGSKLTEFAAWSQWRSRNLSYLLDKRTVGMISGAKLIFSAPKVQWLQVLERLKGSLETNVDDSLQMIELCLLGCASSRWSSLIGHFLSVPYSILPISKQYYEVQQLLQGRSLLVHPEKENDILEFLPTFPNHVQQLWKLPPVLAAMSISSWSPLLRLYMSEIDIQFKGDPSATKCCSCIQNGKDHNDCELAERIWCLFVFHIEGGD